tara:strand:+ start:6370 stop:6696 length:327 start_codon:yes stop_codon:yes gene_type:complete
MPNKTKVWDDDYAPYGTCLPGTESDWRAAYEKVMSEDEADVVLQNHQLPHQILGLPAAYNSFESIKRAYRTIVTKECKEAFGTKPDPVAEARFKVVNAAYSKMMLILA